jgi:hypothetical protein
MDMKICIEVCMVNHQCDKGFFYSEKRAKGYREESLLGRLPGGPALNENRVLFRRLRGRVVRFCREKSDPTEKYAFSSDWEKKSLPSRELGC